GARRSVFHPPLPRTKRRPAKGLRLGRTAACPGSFPCPVAPGTFSCLPWPATPDVRFLRYLRFFQKILRSRRQAAPSEKPMGKTRNYSNATATVAEVACHAPSRSFSLAFFPLPAPADRRSLGGWVAAVRPGAYPDGAEAGAVLP